MLDLALKFLSLFKVSTKKLILLSVMAESLSSSNFDSEMALVETVVNRFAVVPGNMLFLTLLDNFAEQNSSLGLCKISY